MAGDAKARVILLLAGAGLLASLAITSNTASATPTPPPTGDWVIDPGEVVNITAANLTVDGNITMDVGSELHLTAVRLVFVDVEGKRALTGGPTTTVSIGASSLSAQVGPSNGGFGFFIHVDGAFTLDRCLVTGLSGQTIPNPVGETEGIHLTSTASSVTNSTITGAQGYAVTITAGTTTVAPLVADNILQNGGGGVLVAGFVVYRADAQILRNAFSFNTLPHVLVTGSNPTIEGNSFFGSTAGVTVVAGSPRIANNSFVANLLAAVLLSGGGGTIEDNTVSAAGLAFQVSTSTVTIRRNTVTLSATALQASSSTVVFEGNRLTGAFGTGALLNATTLTGRANTIETTLGSPAMRATNGSTITWSDGSLTSASGPGIAMEGGALTLSNSSVSSFLSPLSTAGTAVTLRDATLIGGGSAPVVWLRGGSLDASGGSVRGGSEGLLLDNASSSIANVEVSANSAWGIHSIRRTPALAEGEINSSVHGNGQGDLLVEADLGVRIINPSGEPVPGVNVTITGVSGSPTVYGITGADGRVGPVRLIAVQVDSLNLRTSFSPYAVKAVLSSGWRATGLAPLASDVDLTLALEPNTPPTVTIDAPSAVRLSEAFTARANASDSEGDLLSYRWTIDDGRTLVGRQVGLSFDMPGNHTLTLSVSDGFVATSASHLIAVLTAAEANRLPVIDVEIPRAIYGVPYQALIRAHDPDGDPVVLSLPLSPPGLLLDQTSFRPAQGELSWRIADFYQKSREPQNLTVHVGVNAFDGYGSSRLYYDIELYIPPDQPPAWSPVPDRELTAGQVLSFDLGPFIADPDDAIETLRFNATVSGGEGYVLLLFEPRAGGGVECLLFALRPAPGGSLQVTLVATDAAGLNASVVFRVSIAGAAPTQGQDLSAASIWVPSLLGLVAIAIALWAAMGKSRGRKAWEPPATK